MRRSEGEVAEAVLGRWRDGEVEEGIVGYCVGDNERKDMKRGNSQSRGSLGFDGD